VHCKYICRGGVCESSPTALGKVSGSGIRRIEDMELGNIAFVFETAMASAI
jgi:hypothetical protein